MKSLIAGFLLLVGSSVLAGECSETITIDSVSYPVPAEWCGRRLDSSAIADPAKLVRLPAELSFDDYHIYVLPQTKDAFVRMAAAAKKDGIQLIADSGYRSARYQRQIIRRRLAEGEKPARILSMVAPPGYSQHETGLALDLVPSEASFAKTDIYRWLKSHASEFGFFETYPDDPNRSHPWEPWHWAYHPDR